MTQTTLTAVGGAIQTGNGGFFRARGINITIDVLITAMNTLGPGVLAGTFPGINFVRVNMPDDPSYPGSVIAPYVNALIAQGIVVELEQHTSNNGYVLTGMDLTSAQGRYYDWATTFINDPFVVFGTQNEPVGPPGDASIGAQIDAEITAIYDAVRGAGNNSLILMCPHAGNDTSVLTPSAYANFVNVVWDIHYYNFLSDYSASLQSNVTALQAEIFQTESITNAGGLIPVIVGEYGQAAGYTTSPDPGSAQTIQAVQMCGLGCAAWTWESGNPGPQYISSLVQPPWTGGPSALTAYGLLIAAFLADPTAFTTGPPYPLPPTAGMNAAGVAPAGYYPTGDLPVLSPWQVIISQYANSPIMCGLITSWFSAADATPFFDSFFDNIWNVDTATGYGLDVWGRIVGGVEFTRNIPVITPIPYVSCDDPRLGLDMAGVDIYAPGDPLTEVVPQAMEDTDFRYLVLAVAAANISSGSVSSTLFALNTFFSPYRSPIFINQGANFITGSMAYLLCQYGDVLSLLNLTVLTQDLIPVQQAGVDIEVYVVGSPGGPLAGFDTENPSISGCDYGVLAMTPAQYIASTI